MLDELQVLITGSAPSPNALPTWLGLVWSRSFEDMARAASGGADGEEEGGGLGGGGEEDGWWDAENDGEDGDERSERMRAADPMSGCASPMLDTPVGEQLRACCASLHSLRWLPLIEPTISSMLYARLAATIAARCSGKFGEALLRKLLAWLATFVSPWLTAVLLPSHSAADLTPAGSTSSAALRTWLARLRFYCMSCLASLRTSELFDVIVDYPDSLPALDDLKTCLDHTHLHAETVVSLARSIDQRLLMPGADTANIIQVYVSAIKALRHLDPTGVTLESISERVRTYLKARPDTIRQIVTSLTEPEASELLEGSGGAEEGAIEDDGAAGDEPADADDMKGDEVTVLEWSPDPIQADPSRSAALRSADVLSILVNVYGSKSLFVNEFRSMLADKLLAASGYDCSREVRNLELLKRRFGEAALASCEVMLRDVAESKRVTRSVQNHFGDDNSARFDATIVSRLCWPALPAEAFNLPPSAIAEMARFEKQFMHVKAPRKLVWKPSLGCVTLDVVFTDKTVRDVKCSPIAATVLMAFSDKKQHALSSLSSQLGIPADALRKKLSQWINRGFIVEVSRTPSGDILYESPAALGAVADGTRAAEEEEGEGQGGAAEAQLEQEMRVYGQYVMGMLTNLESLPLGRIHNMLKMFVPASGGEHGYDRTEPELQRFLNRLVEEGKLEMVQGSYKIRR